ncbi:MAG: cytochrome c [Planctomycetes bacterium]|nr:cytochrome c [Planctomycetota bacterium]MCB9908752.1 cytochrome c [Planctomycetota bacterium]MCB9912423.1 cytochrome c [Planctomycetota bacterium]HPF15750.1 cytochrome c [Planctomycetota bacterium]HRV82866.1 cytochrome c [Planctomycetota bacterium]
MKHIALIGLIALLPAACGGGDAGPKLDPATVAAGKKLFVEKGCVLCHGEKGDGDTPTGKALTPPPRNYTDAKWQASVTDDHIKKVVKEGGAANGLSPTMAAYPDTTDQQLTELVAFIRSVKK